MSIPPTRPTTETTLSTSTPSPLSPTPPATSPIPSATASTTSTPPPGTSSATSPSQASPLQGKPAKSRAPANPRMSSRVPVPALVLEPGSPEAKPEAKISDRSSGGSGQPLGKRSASFIMKPQPAPKSPLGTPTSPRTLKQEGKGGSLGSVAKPGSPAKLVAGSASTASTASTSSTPVSTSSSASVSSTSSIGQASEPVLRRVRARSQVEVPTRLLQKSERNYLPNRLADLIVDDILAGEMLADQLHKVGRTDSAFYREKLPPELKPLAQSAPHPTISSSKLIQAMFREDFKTNRGWLAARALCDVSSESMQAQIQAETTGEIEIGTIDPDLKEAIRETLKGRAEVIVRNLLGHPARLKNSPLPERLTDFLVHSDQRFHMQLMQGERTRHFSSSQMRDARVALQKQLLVTYLLLPMLSELAQSRPSQTEIWFLGLLMNSLLKAVPSLQDDVFAQSFATSPKHFQEAVKVKHETEERLEKIEKQRNRTEQRKATFRTGPGHVRSRSADTPLIDTRSLPTREKMQQMRATKQSEALADTLLSEFDDVLKDAEKHVEETEQIRKAQVNLQDFNADDLQLVLDILNDRDGDIEMLAALDHVFQPSPGRAIPLDEDDAVGTADNAGGATTANTTTTPDLTTTAPHASSSQAPSAREKS